MDYEETQELAIIYGKKELIQEFLEIFHMDRAHDGAPLNAILIKGKTKKEVKKWVYD